MTFQAYFWKILAQLYISVIPALSGCDRGSWVQGQLKTEWVPNQIWLHKADCIEKERVNLFFTSSQDSIIYSCCVRSPSLEDTHTFTHTYTGLLTYTHIHIDTYILFSNLNGLDISISSYNIVTTSLQWCWGAPWVPKYLEADREELKELLIHYGMLRPTAVG